MSSRYRLGWYVLASVAVIVCAVPSASAFYTFGLFSAADEYSPIELHVARWTVSEMDTNGDGNIAGDDEGVPITFQGGEDGWSQREISIMKEAFETWEDVPTAYIAFHYLQSVEQQMELDMGLNLAENNDAAVGTVDAFNFIGKVTMDDLGTGVLGLTLISFVPYDTYLDMGGVQVPVSGPAMIDVDIALASDVLSTDDAVDIPNMKFPLKAVTVHEVGHMIGMAHSPMNNITTTVTVEGMDIPVLVEERVFPMWSTSGFNMVGVTPTMFPLATVVHDDGNGLYTAAETDLAPDDIAGVTWLYPRQGSSENFFTIQQRAYTEGRPGFPTFPIALGLVQAWCDVDNNPTTARVPVFSTLTGLYEYQEPFAGEFKMINLFRTITDPSGQTFNATYTFTLSEILPDDYMGYDATAFDGNHLPDLLGGEAGFSPSKQYPWQTFVEGGQNLYQLDADKGTPLYYDPDRRTVVSATSGKTLAQILPGRTPMFGNITEEEMCPLNLAYGAIKNARTDGLLRKLRDNVLLNSSVGVAAVDLYYRVAPSARKFLWNHRNALRVAEWCVGTAEWGYAHIRVLAGLMIAAGLALVGVLLGWRRRKGAALTGILLGVLWMASGAASAELLPMSIEKMASCANDIIQGTVVAKESRWTDRHQIVTDISIKVEDTLKGNSNKGGLFHFTQLGGEKDGIITFSPDLPRWKVGEEAIVFFQNLKSDKIAKSINRVTVCGANGKFRIVRDPATGKKKVRATTMGNNLSLRLVNQHQADGVVRKKTVKPSPEAALQDLDEFKAQVRQMVRTEQKLKQEK